MKVYVYCQWLSVIDNGESSGRRISFGEDTTAHFKKKAPTSMAIQVTGKRLASGSKPRSGKRE